MALLRLSQAVLFTLLCLVSAAVAADLVRVAAQRDNPQLAHRAAPLNADVLIGLIVGRMVAEAPAVEPETIALVEKGRRLHRSDGRFDSLRGMIAHAAEDHAAARSYFTVALDKQPTEHQALRHMLVYALGEGRVDAAARHAFVLAVRWPRQWDEYEPLVVALASSGEGVAALGRYFSADAQSGGASYSSARHRLIDTLLASGRGAGSASSLLLDWHDAGIEGLEPLTGRSISALLAAGETDLALFLDKFSFGEKRTAGSGFVNNARFDRKPSPSAFDWQVGSQQGVSFEWAGQRDDTEGADAGHAAFLRLRFLDSPVRLNNVRQQLLLRPGPHRLIVDARARDLKGPKPVVVFVECAGDARTELARIELDALGDGWERRTAGFEVPQAGCDRQSVYLSNGFMALTWASRYSGVLDVANIQIAGAP